MIFNILSNPIYYDSRFLRITWYWYLWYIIKQYLWYIKMIYDIFVVVGFNDNYTRQILSFWNSFLKCTFLKNERVKKKNKHWLLEVFTTSLPLTLLTLLCKLVRSRSWLSFVVVVHVKCIKNGYMSEEC